MVRIVHNKVLGGWFIVRGPHQTPIAGRFDSREDCLRWLGRDVANEYRRRYTRDH